MRNYRRDIDSKYLRLYCRPIPVMRRNFSRYTDTHTFHFQIDSVFGVGVSYASLGN